ncbi:MAG: hypothetical protein ABIQ64_02475 [Candidatus Saccharimonadales bacterium]
MERDIPKEIIVDELTLLDFDRTLFDTDRFHDIIKVMAYEVAGIVPEHLDLVKKQKEEQEISLHTDELLLAMLTDRYTSVQAAGRIDGPTPDETLSLIFEAVMRYCIDPEVRESLLLPGAKEYIESLNSSGAIERNEVMILTHGTDPLQMLKIICSGLDYLPRLIMDNSEKGKFLSESRDKQGNYRIIRSDGTMIIARSIVMVDDKPIIFTDFPTAEQGARGYLKRTRGKKVLKSQKGLIPKNVEKTYDFPVTTRVLLGSIAVHNSV